MTTGTAQDPTPDNGRPAAEVAPPSGTVAFLFTDIQGSTRLWEQHGAAMGTAVARHDALMRTAIRDNGGFVFKTVGDAFCAAFRTAPEAVAASLAAQRALGGEDWGQIGRIRVRMAVHVGAAEERDGDYFGPPLNRVARLLSAGHGGQVLLSGAAEPLVRDNLPAGVALRAMGEHRLKDLASPERIFQLVVPDLPGDFPPLATLDARPNNLPLQATSFVGRERELGDVVDRLSAHGVRLLTLVGTGGVGKTRLALQAAAEVVERFPQGVWFVPLATLTEAGAVPTAILQALRVPEAGSQSPLDRLKDHLAEKNVLLVLDNLEHIPGANTVVADLLRSCPGLTILATSRSPLRVAGEQELPVGTMQLPALDPQTALADLERNEAVDLFVQRARLVRPDFSLTVDNAATVAGICVRLDGLPLAIELAAARTRIFPDPTALLARLDPRLPLLVGGPRDSPARQRTLRDAIAWSYDLLSADEQALFRRLSVFAGGCSIESAESITSAGGPLGLDLATGLEALTEAGLLRAEPGPGGEPRFAMLETIREYAFTTLQEAGEDGVTREAQAGYLLALLGAAEPELKGANQAHWLDLLEAEHDNLRAGLEWAFEHGPVETRLRLAGGVSGFWMVRGYIAEGRAWLDRAVAEPGEEGGVLRGALLQRAASFASSLGAYERATELLTEAIQIHRTAEDKSGLAAALNTRSDVQFRQSEFDEAEASLSEYLEIQRELGNRRGEAAALNNLGRLLLRQGKFQQALDFSQQSVGLARAIGDVESVAHALGSTGLARSKLGELNQAAENLEESLSIFRELGHKYGMAMVLGHIASLAYGADNVQRARDCYAEALGLFRQIADPHNEARMLLNLGTAERLLGEPGPSEDRYVEARAIYDRIGNREGRANADLNLGDAALARGDLVVACQRFHESLSVFRELGNVPHVEVCVRNLAEVIREHQPDLSARLLGASEAAREAIGEVPAAENGRRFDEDYKLLLEAIDEPRLSEIWNGGRAMTLEEAADEAAAVDCSSLR